MPETNRKIIFACASIVLAVCLCGALLSILGAAALIITDSETFESFSDPDTEVWAEEYTQADYPGISEAIFDQMKKIEKAIISIRGLSPTGGIDRLLYTPEQLRGRVNDEFFGDYTEEDAASDALVLWTFGLIERDADLLQIYIDLYSEAVTGFYDDSTGEMVVVYNSKFGGMESLTYAHEYIHVLQDQNYDMTGALG
ncbi:MAG: hypothetical protein OEZ02_12395, partial [Anaerolineae bacterium]|nr:hypothetical protein [Anaerolineae bacterium]